MSSESIAPVVTSLISQLRRPDWAVQDQVAGELASLGKPALPLLLEALHDQDAHVRAGVAEALGKIGDSQAIMPLVEALADTRLASSNDEGDETKARIHAALALGTIGDPKAFDALAQTLADALISNWTLSWYVIDALSMLGDTRAVPLLIQCLEEPPDTDVMKSARYGLVRFGRSAVPQLIDVLVNKDSKGRAFAAAALGQIGDLRSQGALADILKDDNEHPYLRDEAAIAVGQIGSDEAYDLLYSVFSSPAEDDRLRGSAAIGLGLLGDRRAVQQLFAALNDAAWQMKCDLARALGFLGDQGAVEPLMDLLRDDRDEVVLHAIEALGKLENPRAVPELTRLQQHNDDRLLSHQIKYSAEQAIARIKKPGGSP